MRSERLERQLSEAQETSRFTHSPSEHSTGDIGDRYVAETSSSTNNTAVPSAIGGNGDASRMTLLASEEVCS